MNKELPIIGVSSLGCPKNLVDTENMIGILHGAGYQITTDHNKADLSLVNTCTFIEDSTSESIDLLAELADQGQKLIITGCMAQRFKGELFEELPEAQALVGTANVRDILNVVKEVTKNLQDGKDSKIIKIDEVPNSVADSSIPRIQTQRGFSAYLKIAEGCDHRCAFCIIPYLRGNMKSRSIEDIVKEAQQLVASGIKEIVLVSQDSTAYGTDLYKKRALANLLSELADKSGAKWIRLMYSYPTEMDQEILELIRDKENIVKYIDIPLQHASREVLLKMRRPANVQDTIDLIKSVIPDICLRTTFISGFPGETEKDHQELYDFICQSNFDRVGIFTYSQEDGTAAKDFDDQIEDKIKIARRENLMQAQQKISLAKNQGWIGKKLRVLIDEVNQNPDGFLTLVTRSFRDAPEIDGQVYVKLKEDEICPLDFANVLIDSCDEYDLFGTLA